MKKAFDVDDWNESTTFLSEKDIESRCKAKARKAGWWVRKFFSPKRTAVPDDIFAKEGTVFFVEFKAPGKTATEKQREEHKLMRKAGLVVYVCDDIEAFDGILDAEEERAIEYRDFFPPL